MKHANTIVALVLVAAAAGPAIAAGSISGKVDATPGKYLEETVVYLKEVPGTYTPKTVIMDQKGMTFLPHLLTITVGDSVKFNNSDGVDHNVYSPDGDGYNLGMISKGQAGAHTFTKPGAYSQLCSVHPEMLAYVYVGQNPYAAVVAKDGKYTIKGIPAGTYQLNVWNPRLKAVGKSVTVANDANTDAGFSIKR
jgi:plastocyanin